MNHVDALSRYPSNIVHSVEETEIEFQLCVTQNRDQNTLDLKSKLEKGPVEPYELSNSVLYRKNADGKIVRNV